MVVVRTKIDFLQVESLYLLKGVSVEINEEKRREMPRIIIFQEKRQKFRMG